MKKVLFITILLLNLFAYSQNKEKVSLSVNTEPNAFIRDGFNIGFDIELQENWFYIGAGTYQFPNLNSIGYQQYHGIIGLNHRNQKDNLRIYSGFLGGLTIRERNPHQIIGFEGGVEYYFGRFGIGLESLVLRRQDIDFYEDSLNKWSYNGAVKLIYKIKL